MNPLIPSEIAAYVPEWIEIAYLIASVLFILGLKRLSSPATARAGNQLASLAMFIGVAATLFHHEILSFEYIIAGVILGGLIGTILAKKVEMTAMPELVALFNGFGGAASALVASGEYLRVTDYSGFAPADLITISISVFIGWVTFTGSLIAFGKLKGILSGRPFLFPGQSVVQTLLVLIIVVGAGYLVVDPTEITVFYAIAGAALLLGIFLVIPIGGGDMPVIISLLNSLSGLAAAATGFVLNNNLLIISGTLVGASGLILTNIMCKAMNRSLFNVIFSGFGGGDGSAAAGSDGDKSYREVQSDDVAVMTAYAKKVIIVPGYGLAVAQAQHTIREVAALLESKGVEVKYGIHPVAGRMPGHMNVLLAEANVPYDQLFDMEQINPEFKTTDVVLIIGANDVVNPAARTNPGSPIYGMPVLNVDEAAQTVVFKRSMNPGFAGIDNELFYKENNSMYFGDAKASLQKLVAAIKEL